MELARHETNLLGKKTKRFMLQAKNFFLTYPRCDMSKEDAAALLQHKLALDYLMVAAELHQDGTPHLHALITAKSKAKITNSNFFDLGHFHGNYQTARKTDDVREYIMKADQFPLEIGQYSSNDQSSVQKRALENKKILETPLHQLVDSGDISIFSYQVLTQAKNLYMLDKMDVPEYMPKKCIWIYGATGIGKSRYVRDNFPGLFYNKPQNKWWDGYKGEKVILLDDFDLKGECLGHYLKIWGDCYSFNAEVKGSTIKPCFDHFFITSQYLPKDIFCQGTDQSKWDNELRLAIERRFEIKTIVNGELVDL